MSSSHESSSQSSATVTEPERGRGRDVEAQSPRKELSYYKRQFDQAGVTPAVLEYDYRGSGTHEDPFVVDFIPGDPKNPMEFAQWKKWGITVLQAIAVLAVTFVSTAYSGGIGAIIEDFKCSEEIAILGISLFVLGFAIGYVQACVYLPKDQLRHVTLTFLCKAVGVGSPI